ncbi:DUF3025 domain-containing protein [Ideonella sp. BN130291]|uniref:DUF3025 domain-containing protein n=1 Tax=Ideonella sp. BN130291 TaxID=3112940 RepID=UPI002E2716D0|nr:DUF3025 domain-containing protein [Ideonella sp. BN130291]
MTPHSAATGSGCSPGSEPIDWAAPWLAPYRLLGAQVEHGVRAGRSVAEALNETAVPGVPRFVPHSALPAAEAYEAFIFRTGQVPTRDNLHDFFNGLVWLHQPALKARLNALQAEEIGRRGIAASRGPLRDALTVFDENGALLEAPADLVAALRARDWHGAFVRQRAAWRETRLVLVGHALLEKLLHPRKPITAHALLAGSELAACAYERKSFLPLPVLGVPGWWPANEDAAFYDDASVFRPAPQLSAGRKPSIER